MIAIVGSGRVGANVAVQIVTKELDDLTLIDVAQNLPQGEALDLQHMAASYGIDLKIKGTNDFSELGRADLIIVAAGFGRKPGQTRLDLMKQNSGIIASVSKEIAKYAKSSMVLMITNPMDAMTYVAHRVTGFPTNRVFGMGGMLDSCRFKSLLAQELGVSSKSLGVMVIGEHGESMVPLPRFSSVSGVALEKFLSKKKMDEAVEMTRKIAAEVIALKGATIYGPSASVASMVDAIVNDRKSLMPASVYLNGEFGVSDIYIGVPAIIGRDGIERIVEVPLDEAERAIFLRGVTSLKDAISTLDL
ncbi:MAG: malate dehydrogenase [Thaumarchaeota archaeon]|nr:malate dehydrogenase [Nitrososphaerota archaeon]